MIDFATYRVLLPGDGVVLGKFSKDANANTIIPGTTTKVSELLALSPMGVYQVKDKTAVPFDEKSGEKRLFIPIRLLAP